MFKSKYLFLILVFVLVIGVLGTPSAQASYTLVWSDEFDGASLDMNKWSYETGGGGWGNNELEYYTAGGNCTVSGGILTITAKKESMGGYNYTSTRIITKGKFDFTYGKVEARIALPMGKGLWPAFWMLGSNISTVSWPACGEIDIMEHVNNEYLTYGTIHWDNNGHAQYGNPVNLSTPTSFHTYSIEWTASYIKWYLDGVQYGEGNILNGINGTQEFHNPFFLLLNFAVGGNWPGNPDATTVFPATYKIDYVRVYQDNGGIATPTPTPPPGNKTIPGTIEAESYNAMSGIQTENCSEGGQNVGWTDAGDWMDYDVNVQMNGTYAVDFRVASPYNNTQFQLKNGSTVLATVTVPNTGGYQTWTTVTIPSINLTAGNQTLRVSVLTNGWNFNWLRFNLNGSVTPTPPSGANLAKNKPATASSYENPTSLPASNAVDGNTGTRWSSAFSDPQWIYVDLGATYSIRKVVLNWEAAYGKSYQIQVSSNATNWTTVWSTTSGTGGIVTATFAATNARYVRMYGTVRGTPYGYSLYEFEVYQ